MFPTRTCRRKTTLTNILTSTISNDRGDFTFNFLPIGDYSFSVDASGFQGQVRNDVELSAGQTLHVDFQLKVGDIKESVTVSGATALLAVDSSEQHSVMETKDVHELPLAKLDWTSLLSLGNGFEKAGGNGGAAINGLAPSGLNLTVDGTNASNNSEDTSLTFYGGFNVINTVNTEAIAEVSTTKGIAPASVAGSMSGNINIITKSGTNQFHGSLFEINSLSDYNARNQFLSSQAALHVQRVRRIAGRPHHPRQAVLLRLVRRRSQQHVRGSQRRGAHAGVYGANAGSGARNTLPSSRFSPSRIHRTPPPPRPPPSPAPVR